jgi:hypothetical protein
MHPWQFLIRWGLGLLPSGQIGDGRLTLGNRQLDKFLLVAGSRKP